MLFALLFITITIDFSCGSTTTIQSNVSSCLENERQALIDFKENLTDEAHRLRSWVGKDCCTWKGVGCSWRTGHVIKLHLRNPIPSNGYNYVDYGINKLTGEMTPSFVDLKHLSYLDLSGNNISGLDFLGSLKSLRYLSLSSEPYVLCNLSRLVYVDLSDNSLQGSVPYCFGNHTSLSVLKLSENGFEGPLPSCMGNMTQLTVLDLHNNGFKGEIPNSLRNLRSLRVLDLSFNKFNGEILSSVVGEFKNLECLLISDLSNNLFSGPIPVADYDEIDVLILSNNHFSGGIPVSLCNATGIALIDLSKNHLSGKIPRCMGNLGEIIVLDLSSNNLHGQIPSSLGFLQRLEYLHLRNNSFHGELPLSLQNLTALEHGNTDYRVNPSSRYFRLCGAPLTKGCPGDESADDGDRQVLVNEGDRDDDDAELMWFYAGIGPGFVGLLGVFCTLYFKRKWRYAYFQLIEDAYDGIFVAIAVKANWLRRKFHPQR
ncbi:hypothetical protein RHGRI_001123 [Rhododendron griersonianum]|uniref:Leucine-rich repeat-containing N-terminal plant-type domain-containing protein n=1 Tax=Rhododendron griersonianum TaxID=479676 RepID=A0AAV6LK85_9ERIC|nr:hypothetical protein RHGRI_001123 [Rhododendron griersonianum]